MKQRYCFNCGDEVDEKDWDYIGHTRLWVCGKRECQREFGDAYEGAYEEEAERLHDDWFGR